jgi:hypothetical protein
MGWVVMESSVGAALASPPDQQRGRDQDAEDQVAGQAEPLAELVPGGTGGRAGPHVQHRPGQRACRGPAGEPPVGHPDRAGDHRQQRVDHGDEPRGEHRPAAAAVEELLGLGPVAGAQPAAEAAGPEPIPEPAADQVPDRLAGQRPGDGDPDQGQEPPRCGGGGAGEQHHCVAGDQQADQRGGLQRGEQAGEQVQDHWAEAGQDLQQTVDEVEEHAPTLARLSWLACGGGV